MMVDLVNTCRGGCLRLQRFSAAIQGSTDTMFYVLAVYFGGVGVRKTRYAVSYALWRTLRGRLQAVIAAYNIFFG